MKITRHQLRRIIKEELEERVGGTERRHLRTLREGDEVFISSRNDLETKTLDLDGEKVSLKPIWEHFVDGFEKWIKDEATEWWDTSDPDMDERVQYGARDRVTFTFKRADTGDIAIDVKAMSGGPNEEMIKGAQINVDRIIEYGPQDITGMGDALAALSNFLEDYDPPEQEVSMSTSVSHSSVTHVQGESRQISRRQLRRIIKEEISRAFLSEGGGLDGATHTPEEQRQMDRAADQRRRKSGQTKRERQFGRGTGKIVRRMKSIGGDDALVSAMRVAGGALQGEEQLENVLNSMAVTGFEITRDDHHSADDDHIRELWSSLYYGEVVGLPRFSLDREAFVEDLTSNGYSVARSESPTGRRGDEHYR